MSLIQTAPDTYKLELGFDECSADFKSVWCSIRDSWNNEPNKTKIIEAIKLLFGKMSERWRCSYIQYFTAVAVAPNEMPIYKKFCGANACIYLALYHHTDHSIIELLMKQNKVSFETLEEILDVSEKYPDRVYTEKSLGGGDTQEFLGAEKIDIKDFISTKSKVKGQGAYMSGVKMIQKNKKDLVGAVNDYFYITKMMDTIGFKFSYEGGKKPKWYESGVFKVALEKFPNTFTFLKPQVVLSSDTMEGKPIFADVGKGKGRRCVMERPKKKRKGKRGGKKKRGGRGRKKKSQ